MSNPSDQLNEMAARLKAFGVIMRLGHDLFSAADFTTACAMAVNNACPVVGYKSSTVVRMMERKADIVAQYAQVTVNQHTSHAVMMRDLCEKLGEQDEILELSSADAGKYGEPVSVLCPDECTLVVIPLKPPDFMKKADFRLLWVLEFDAKAPPYAMTAAKLLAASYSEALYSQKLAGGRVAFRPARMFSFKRIFLFLLLAGVIAVMFYRVPESVTTEFELVAPERQSTYAWFDGPILKCYKQDGELVKKGDLIAEYDMTQLQYRLSSAESSVRETEAELELKERASFNDRDRLGEIKLLQERLKSARVAVEEAKWYIDHSRLTAPSDGILALADTRAEFLTGKVVRTGDKIFDILGGAGMHAEIPVNERESSILLGKPSEVTLFLHTSPERPIIASVSEIRPYPELTEQRTYCYNVTAVLPESESSLNYGMRGIAKLHGEKVMLGYHLFKSIILYIRGI